MNRRHELFMMSIKLSATEMGRKDHGVRLVPARVKTLGENLKQQPICQDILKNVLSNSSQEIDQAIPFASNRDLVNKHQQSQLVEVVH